MMDIIFKNGLYNHKVFIMQLPFLYGNDTPRTVEITPSSAYSMVKNKVCECRHAEGDIYILSPIIPAAQNVEYMIGAPKV